MRPLEIGIFYCLALLTPQIALGQRVEFTPYLGVEAEILYSIDLIPVEELLLISQVNPSTVTTYGVFGKYAISDTYGLLFDLNYRPSYLYSYIIYDEDPSPDHPFSSRKVSITGLDELTSTVAGYLTVRDRRNWKILLQLGIGYNVTIDGPGQDSVDFGEDLLSTTQVFNTLQHHPTRNSFIARMGTSISFKRFMVEARYIHTLNKSITDPFLYNGRGYSYINKRNGLQLVLGYQIPIH